MFPPIYTFESMISVKIMTTCGGQYTKTTRIIIVILNSNTICTSLVYIYLDNLVF